MHENPKLLECEQALTRESALHWSDITLRDIFAAFALAGMVADSTCEIDEAMLADSAYHYADVMLDAREKKDAQ